MVIMKYIILSVIQNLSKKIKQIDNSIIFLHTSTYNIWHHYVEMICIIYHYLIKFKNTKKKIFIPYNKDSFKD